MPICMKDQNHHHWIRVPVKKTPGKQGQVYPYNQEETHPGPIVAQLVNTLCSGMRPHSLAQIVMNRRSMKPRTWTRMNARDSSRRGFKNVPILSDLPPVPYLEKIIGVFSNIGGFDILAFIMIVHEYTGVLSKKNNTVHIHFLGSVSSKEKK
ncbi:hypothetical protein CAEBREN_28807 [Caenorhabditis brenneri]|uniref:Uncharacterized protein n=1 Tax=Caenorhabditis brenneri TaxID=135651 RepID=G0PDT1_CAEBE|nr:hypothetical protein CAEBREN_28807 [Caenorhabditis brenneri]